MVCTPGNVTLLQLNTVVNTFTRISQQEAASWVSKIKQWLIFIALFCDALLNNFSVLNVKGENINRPAAESTPCSWSKWVYFSEAVPKLNSGSNLFPNHFWLSALNKPLKSINLFVYQFRNLLKVIKREIFQQHPEDKARPYFQKHVIWVYSLQVHAPSPDLNNNCLKLHLLLAFGWKWWIVIIHLVATSCQ